MQEIKRVLVGLDLSEMDHTLMAYTCYLTSIMPIDKVYFFHIAKSLELPSELLEKYPDLVAPSDEVIEENIKKSLEKSFPCQTPYEIKVLEGNPQHQILHWADIKEVDLIILGKKLSLKGSGLLTNRLAKVGHCSVLSVPENSPPKITKILTPIDFSSSSQLAFEQAIGIANNCEVDITLQHTFSVPTGYHASGKSYEEFAEIVKENCQRAAKNFIVKLNSDPNHHEIVLSLDDHGEPSKKICHDAREQGVDLIIISSKGRSSMANILLGSVADKVLRMNVPVPIMVVKDKHKNMGFLDALLKV